MSALPVTAPAAVGPAPVWDLVNGFARYQALRTALELGLVDALDPGALTGAELAAVLHADPDGVQLLAEVLVSLGVLGTDGTAFSLTPVAQRFLVSGSPASMATLVALSPGPARGWQQLAATLRTGAPTPETIADLDGMYPALVAATGPTQRAVAAGVLAELQDRGLWPARPTVVDLGCGSGAWLGVLAGAGATGVGVDSAPVLATVAPLPGVQLVAGDYLQVPLPVSADVVVLAHVLRAEPAERARALLHRALDLAGDTGVVVVADYPRPDAGAAPAELAAAQHELLLSLTMRAATGGTGITVGRLRDWAASSGAEITAVLEPVPRQTVVLIQRTGGAA